MRPRHIHPLLTIHTPPTAAPQCSGTAPQSQCKEGIRAWMHANDLAFESQILAARGMAGDVI